MKYPFLREEKIEAAADQLLHVAFGSSQQVTYPLDLETLVFDHLCEREDLVFRDDRDLGWEDDDRILGKTRPLQNTILISAHLRWPSERGRYRFTVAHEIGHWVLHRKLFLGMQVQPNLFANGDPVSEELVSLHRNVFPAGKPIGPPPPEEWQANRFAVALLVDSTVLREAFVRRFGQPPLVAHDKVGTEPSPSLRELSRIVAAERVRGQKPLHDRFGLSREAMAISLETRGYVLEGPPLV